MSTLRQTLEILLNHTPAFDETGDLSLSDRAQFLVDHLRDAENTIATLRSELDAAKSRVKDLEQLNLSTHSLKEEYKRGWIEWSGKAYHYRRLFKIANAKKRRVNIRAKTMRDSANFLLMLTERIRQAAALAVSGDAPDPRLVAENHLRTAIENFDAENRPTK